MVGAGKAPINCRGFSEEGQFLQGGSPGGNSPSGGSEQVGEGFVDDERDVDPPKSKVLEPSTVAALGHPAWESGPETLGPSDFPCPSLHHLLGYSPV